MRHKFAFQRSATCLLAFILTASALHSPPPVAAQEPAAAKKSLRPVNLALGKPATASATQDGHSPGDAVDGDPETRWCAPDNGDGYWWRVDLQKPETLTGCRIAWEQENQPYQYKIEGSADGQSWKELVRVTSGPRPRPDEQKFTASGLRYARITITKAPPGAWASFSEFEVFGDKLTGTPAKPVKSNKVTDSKAPAGFKITKFAVPTDISYPTCIAAAPTGEVFVGVDQNGSLDAKPDRGWVVRCIDTEGDGIADRFNIFAKMDSPRGIVFDHNTLYVMHPPFVEAYYDDDGDGVADRSEILVSGVGRDLKFRGADHTSNGLRLGIDGWLYIACGDYGAINAAAKDGSHLQLHGGGILRVRPDGSHLELVVRGTRNIYDVAIDPLMNLLTCDNTNDGDDWNVRLSHMIPTANYGYPTLFRNFSDEMVPTMADYGGGSPTGSIFLDEPGYPNGFGHGFYTCQWGWNTVTRHPLTAVGSSFTPQKEPFIEIPRPTGIDEDGSGHLYVASWKGATFTYAGPNAGFILLATPEGYQAPPFPNLAKASDEELLGYLNSPSAVRRLHFSREIVRRGDRPVFVTGLEKLAASNADLTVRAAALFTLKQILHARANEPLLRLAQYPELREFAIRELGDHVEDAASLPTGIFTSALHDSDPRVRVQALAALNRLGRREAAADILPLTTDLDTGVSHLAFRALVDLDAADVCLKALDGSSTALISGAARVVRNLHEPAVVDGLIGRLGKDQPATTRQLILQALCRLYYREADWDGSWWGTRPDTSGPDFRPVTWDQSEKIAQVLKTAVTGADEESLRFLLPQLRLHKIDAPPVNTALLELAASKPRLRASVVGLFAGQPALTGDAITLLENVADSATQDPALRSEAFAGLQKNSQKKEAAEAAVRVLVDLLKKDPQSALGTRLRTEFVTDRRHARNTDYFVKLAGSEDPARSRIGYAVLLNASNARGGGRQNGASQARNAVRQTLEDAWTVPTLPSLILAIGDLQLTNYTSRVEEQLISQNPDTATAAALTMARLKPAGKPAAAAASDTVIAKLPYDKVLAETIKTPGDPTIGGKLFETLGCVKCHTISKSEPVKGPFLGDITARYNRAEIVESILRPNAHITQGFETHWIQTKDDQDFEGFIVRESGEQVEMRNLVGPAVIAKKDIVKRGVRTTSIMPEGLADQSTPAQLASLLAYLESLRGK